MSTPETKLTVETYAAAYQPEYSLSFNHQNREIFRITPDARMICGEGLSKEEATQQAAKLLIAAFEEQIQKMVDARAEKAEAELAEMSSIAEKWEDDALRYARNAEYWKSRAEKAEAKIITARSALSRIANSDYRGNRSLESQIAFAALEEIK
jgi:rhamnose utilization protein RhaD (predicted bifunctional aldolase and dehydrogenase)